MRTLERLLVIALIVVGASAPLTAMAQVTLSRPFGGTVVSWTICAGGIIQIVVAGPRPGIFAWMPGTLTFLNGPPKLGSRILGLALPATAPVCFLGGFPLPGNPIIMQGTSLAI